MRDSYNHAFPQPPSYVQTASGDGLTLPVKVERPLQLRVGTRLCLNLLHCCRRSDLHKMSKSEAFCARVQGFARIL